MSNRSIRFAFDASAVKIDQKSYRHYMANFVKPEISREFMKKTWTLSA